MSISVLQIFLPISLSAHLALGALGATSSKSLQKCTTLLGKTSKTPVPSTTHALIFTSRATVKSTSTPTSTITPAPFTFTFSTTSTATVTITLDQVTDTFSETTTITSADTGTITPAPVTTTVIPPATTTTVTPPTTIAPSAGFTPVSSQIPRKRKRNINSRLQPRRALPAPAALPNTNKGVKCSISNGKPTFSPAIYPTSVLCSALVQVYQTSTVTFTATKVITTTLAASTISTTSTFSTTTTTTITPIHASTTTTLTATASATTTTTLPASTVTTTAAPGTVTETAPQATYYAACGPDNLQSTINGQSINDAAFYHGAPRYDAGSPYDCCVACLTDPACGATISFPGYCFGALNGGVCDPTNVDLTASTNPNAPPSTFVSNSNCGRLDSR